MLLARTPADCGFGVQCFQKCLMYTVVIISILRVVAVLHKHTVNLLFAKKCYLACIKCMPQCRFLLSLACIILSIFLVASVLTRAVAVFPYTVYYWKGRIIEINHEGEEGGNKGKLGGNEY